MARGINDRELKLALSSIVDSEEFETLAAQTGVVRRKRKVDIVALVWILVFGFWSDNKRTLSGLRRLYEVQTGTTLAPSAFYARLNDRLARMFRRLLAMVTERTAHRGRKLGGTLAFFEDIMVADATVFKVHERLSERWPSTGRNNLKAAIKLHMVMSVVGCGAKTVKITSERVKQGKKMSVGA